MRRSARRAGVLAGQVYVVIVDHKCESISLSWPVACGLLLVWVFKFTVCFCVWVQTHTSPEAVQASTRSSSKNHTSEFKAKNATALVFVVL